MPKRRIQSRREASKTDLSSTLREIFNRNFTIVTLINFLVMTIYYLLFITTASYSLQTYNISLSVAGLTAGIIVIGCLIARFVTSNLISLYGLYKTLLAGLILYAASIGAFFVANNLWLLFVERFFTGVAVGIIGTATGTIVAYVVPVQHHGFGISLFSMSTMLALALGPFLGISLGEIFNYNQITLIVLAGAIACLLIAPGMGKLPPMLKRVRPLLKITSYIDPRVVSFSLVALIVCLNYGCVQAFITSFAAERNLAEPAAIFFLVYAFTALLTRPISGRLYDRHGEHPLFYPVLLLTALATFLLAQAHSAWLLLLSGVIMGAGFANFQSVSMAVSVSLVSRSRYAHATTTFFIFHDLGIGLGPYIFGFLVPSLGFAGMYRVLAAIVALSTILYYFLHHEKYRHS